MATSVTMSRMVDLALGTPEIGAVNYNVLHTLLHAMLQRLNMSEHRAEMSNEDRELLILRSTSPAPKTSGSEVVESDKVIKDAESDKPIQQSKTHYHALENTVRYHKDVKDHVTDRTRSQS